MSLDFDHLRTVNWARQRRWHGCGEWSVSDWAVATAGEFGEACNAIKKLRRVQEDVPNISEPGRELYDEASAKAAIAEELADTMIYLDLLAAKLEIDLGTAVIAKFNKTSEKYSFPEKL